MNYSSPIIIEKIEYDKKSNGFRVYEDKNSDRYHYCSPWKVENGVVTMTSLYEVDPFDITYSIYNDKNCLLVEALSKQGYTIQDLINRIEEEKNGVKAHE